MTGQQQDKLLRLLQNEVQILNWTTTKVYNINALVIVNNSLYRANVTHTSDVSSFVTDISKWDLVHSEVSAASMYEQGNDTELPLTSAGTFYKITSMGTGKDSGVDLVKPDPTTNDRIDVGAKGAGTYRVSGVLELNIEPHKVITLAVFKNGIQVDSITAGCKTQHPPWKLASTATPIYSTIESGVISDLDTVNATYLVMDELNDTPGFILDIDFNTPARHSILQFWGRYDGQTIHAVELQIRNFTKTISYVSVGANDYVCYTPHTSSATDQPEVGANWQDYWALVGTAGAYGAWVTATVYESGYEDLRAATKDLPHASGEENDYYKEFNLPTGATWDDYNDGSKHTMRFVHITDGANTHNLYIDKLQMRDYFVSNDIHVDGILELVAGDYVDLRVKSVTSLDTVVIKSANLIIERI
jgi:hypothetical protein